MATGTLLGSEDKFHQLRDSPKNPDQIVGSNATNGGFDLDRLDERQGKRGSLKGGVGLAN